MKGASNGKDRMGNRTRARAVLRSDGGGAADAGAHGIPRERKSEPGELDAGVAAALDVVAAARLYREAVRS